VLQDSAPAERHCCWTVLSDVNAVENCWPLLLNIPVNSCCCGNYCCEGLLFGVAEESCQVVVAVLF